MWKNSHLVTFFPFGEGYKYEDKEWTKLLEQERYVLYPSGKEYRRNTYQNVRQNWVVEDVADGRRNNWRSRSRERYQRSENRMEIAHKRRTRSTSRSRDRYERSDYRNEIGEERTKRQGGEERRRITLGGTKRKYDSSAEERDRSYSTEEIPRKKGRSERSTQKEDNTKNIQEVTPQTPERKYSRQTIAVTNQETMTGIWTDSDVSLPETPKIITNPIQARKITEMKVTMTSQEDMKKYGKAEEIVGTVPKAERRKIATPIRRNTRNQIQKGKKTQATIVKINKNDDKEEEDSKEDVSDFEESETEIN